MNMLYAQSMSDMQLIPAIAAGSTAIDIARTLAEGSADFTETLAVFRQLCCSTCGMTSASRGLHSSPLHLNLSRF